MVSFYDERGVDVPGETTRALDDAVGDVEVTVRETDPWRASVTLPRGEDALAVAVDGAGRVTGVEAD